jgi:hypothetical protein
MLEIDNANRNEQPTSAANGQPAETNCDSAKEPGTGDSRRELEATSPPGPEVSGTGEDRREKEDGKRRGPVTPEGKARSSQNSRKHGLFARDLHFSSNEEREQFDELHEELQQDRKPRGALQEMIVRQMAKCVWYLLWVQQRIALEFSKRDGASWATTLREFMGKSKALALPLPDGSQKAEAWLPWDCKELSLKLVGGDHNVQNLHEVSGNDLQFVKDMKNKRSRNDTVQRFELELKLGDSLETLRRYEAALRRELFQYIEILDRLQRRKVTHDD